MRQYASRLFAVLTIAAIAITFHAVTATADVFTDPVGFVKVTVTNQFTGATASNNFTAVGLPLQQMRADQGIVTSVSSNVIGVSGTCQTCGSSNYWDSTKLHYVEFAKGGGIGRYFAVQTNTATTITLAVGTENLTALGSGGAVATGDRYVIRPFWTLSTVLGNAATTPLKAAAALNNADNVLIFDSGTQLYITFFAKIASGATNWSRFGTVPPQNTFPILPDEVLFVKRNGGGIVTNIILLGDVKTTNSTTVLQKGFNYVANTFPAGVTLANSQLLAAGFRPGANQASADILYLWNPATQLYQTLFDHITGGPVTNWNLVGTAGATNNFVLDFGRGYFVNTKVSGAYWNRSVPYQVP